VVSDRMVGPEGDVRQGSTADAVTADVARRLQVRLDRVLDRLHLDRTADPELLAGARRMRRDSETLLLLCGADPGARPAGPRGLGDLLDEVAGTAPLHVSLREVVAVQLQPDAALELLHVLGELVDHVATAHPGAGLTASARTQGWYAGDQGVVVELLVNSLRPTPGPPARPAVAEQLARRSRAGLELRRSEGASGPLLSVHCPPSALVVEESAWSSVAPLSAPLPDPLAPHGSGHTTNGNGHTNGHTNGHGNGNGNGHSTANGYASAVTGTFPGYRPSASSQVDELFGPLVHLPMEPADDRSSTPIFEAIASAWFREDQPDSAQPRRPDPLDPSQPIEPMDWETPHDREWRDATARMNRPDPLPSTPNGLPRRRPGDQLVPPRRRRADDGSVPGFERAERVPDRVRDRLSTYQRGLNQGRHRAPGTDRDEGSAW
jgi:hypothetical protein